MSVIFGCWGGVGLYTEGQRGLPTRALALYKEHQTRDYNVHMEGGVGDYPWISHY